MGWEEVRRREVIFGLLASVKECDDCQIRRIGRDGEGWEEEHGGLDQPSVRPSVHQMYYNLYNENERNIDNLFPIYIILNFDRTTTGESSSPLKKNSKLS